ncbi:MAG TPA: hypothetical protein VE760_08350 [Acidimicrobiales bacterium]|nr:hypothetical protein [Acidimicrobiales bacterium]
MKRTVRQTLFVTFLAGAVLAGGVGDAVPATAATPPSKAHWGWYSWGSEQVPARAFWLIDRTGNETMHQAIEGWAYVWNDGRARYLPALPYVAVYRDDANVGACFHTGLPQYSLALACAGSPTGNLVDTSVQIDWNVPPHIVSPFMRLHPGLDLNTMFTMVCHGMGIMLGFGVSNSPTSCMHNTFALGQLLWYDAGDAATAVELYNSHNN